MKKLVWIIFLLGTFQAWSQEMDSLAIDTLEKEPPPYHLGIYAVGGASYEASIPDQNLASYYGLGIQYENWSIEFKQYEFHGRFETFIIFPSVFSLEYSYGGIDASYQFYQPGPLGIWLSGQYYRGDMLWRNVTDSEVVLRDEFNLIKVGLKAEYDLWRYVKPHLQIGYQRMGDLNLAEAGADRFSGIYFGAGLRLGYFNQ